jgi:Ser/Thr protein kinase RdoA (MazF antagonist)
MDQDKSKNTLREIGKNFKLLGDFTSAEPYGSGHINDTYKVTYNQAGTSIHYLFQRVNHNLFKDVPQLMENISRVCSHIQNKLREEGLDDTSRKSLTLIKTNSNTDFLLHNETYWRVYLFIEKATGYDIVETETQAYEAAKAFGEFQKHISDLPGKRFNETIPDFHNSIKRYEALEAAIGDDPKGRVRECEEEIEYARNNKELASQLIKLKEDGLIPERITHNDTKLNNVLIDNETQKATCVIDLDTVMPGLALYDFGDLMRTSTSPAPEDETDLTKVRMQINMFEALAKGYLESAKDFLNEHEIKYLPASGMTITYTIGLRFLTDYLLGDTYFKTTRPYHNLERCRTQFKLVKSMGEQLSTMSQIIDELK